jgi:GLPGLI family protein
MKKFILGLVLFSQISFSQETKDAILNVDYDEYRIYTQGFINLDLGTLLVSKKISYYHSIVQKKITNDLVPDESAIMFKKGIGNKEILPEIIIDRERNLLTERLFENLYLESYFAVQEPLPKMKWKLLNEKKIIGEYNCKKASVEFRGRTYYAWYTIEIPISLGPWKFNGLPGLILEVDDQKGIYKWQAKTVSYNTNFSEKEILIKVQNGTKFENISFKDYDAKRVKKVQDKIQTIKSRSGGRGAQFGMMTTFEFDKEPVNEYRTEMQFN